MLPCLDWPIKISTFGNKMIYLMKNQISSHEQFKCIETLLCLTILRLTFTAPLERSLNQLLHQEVSLICYIMVCNTLALQTNLPTYLL